MRRSFSDSVSLDASARAKRESKVIVGQRAALVRHRFADLLVLRDGHRRFLSSFGPREYYLSNGGKSSNVFHSAYSPRVAFDDS